MRSDAPRIPLRVIAILETVDHVAQMQGSERAAPVPPSSPTGGSLTVCLTLIPDTTSLLFNR